VPPSSDPLYTRFPEPLPGFSLTERSGRTVTRNDLLGKIWVVSFFFTSCTAGCAQNTASMKHLQDALAGYPDVMLVSITVDPQSDTPDKLQEYAARYGADPKHWLFLTGQEKAIDDLVQHGFFWPVQRKGSEATPGNAVIHTWALVI